jgi:hypothetical protein
VMEEHCCDGTPALSFERIDLVYLKGLMLSRAGL